jgi:hypothetical protein
VCEEPLYRSGLEPAHSAKPDASTAGMCDKADEMPFSLYRKQKGWVRTDLSWKQMPKYSKSQIFFL